MAYKKYGRASCPVCAMMVSKESHFSASFKGRTYYFCCEECMSSFLSNPYEYLQGGGKG